MAVTNYYTVNGALIGEKTVGGSRTDYLTDAHGSVTATVNQSGQVVNTYRYKPYGAQLAKMGVGADPSFQWVGSQGYRQTDKKYSDVYVRARHYDSLSGRWATPDPAWHNTLNGTQPSRGFGVGITDYRYVGERPTVDVDGSGRRVSPCDKLGDGWEEGSASKFWCKEKSMGTTCLKCRVILQTWPKDPCRWCKNATKRFTPQSCYCPTVLSYVGTNVAARPFGKTGDDCLTVLQVADAANTNKQVTVTVVDDGPYANDANIDLHTSIVDSWGHGKDQTFPVCTKRINKGPGNRNCKRGFNTGDKNQDDKKDPCNK